MGTQKNNDRLDNLIFRTINTEKPQFDAEKWKQKYPDEYQTLISRGKTTSSRQPNILRIIFSKSSAQVAAAAVILVAVSLLMVHQNPPIPQQPQQTVNVVKSPAEMLTARSLMTAYRHGGIEAIDSQCENAFEMLGQQRDTLNVKELFAEIEVDLERTEL
jgi:hypothetical protein